MMTKDLLKNTFLLLTLSSIISFSAFAEIKEKILIGDPIHGQKLYNKATKETVKQSGSWINTYSDKQSLAYLQNGKKSFPKINSENPLDFYDALAYIRSQNIEIKDLNIDASHILVTGGKLDQYAIERLKERAQITVPKNLLKRRVFVAFQLDAEKKNSLERVYPKNAKIRDLLKPKKKTAYIVFMPINHKEKGLVEAALIFNPQMKLIDIRLATKDFVMTVDSDKYLAKLLNQGARGKYNAVKIPKKLNFGSKASFDKQLNAAFLIASELIYMYEVKERDYFAFDVE